MSTTNATTNHKCQVCFTEDKNGYFECMDCHIIVHETCYGLSWIDIESNNSFVCDACKEKRKHKDITHIQCCVCPVSGGALKRTSCNQWCHIFCALWIPELGIANIITKSPIINIGKIAPFRKTKKCSICKVHDNASACIKCEYHECCDYVHPMCTTNCHTRNRLHITPNICRSNDLHNNHLVTSAMHQLGSFLWYFLCTKHMDCVTLNDIKRIEILKLLSKEWPYWKIHPNPMFVDPLRLHKHEAQMAHDDKMMAILDLINNDKLLLQALPTQKMIKTYENIIYAMHNMPIALSTNIGPIGLLNASIKEKYDKNTKFATNLNKTSVNLIWSELQNTLNYNVNTATQHQPEEDHNKNTKEVSTIPLHEKLKRDDIELSRNEVINLLWNSKEKFFGDITCAQYLRISPYDLRYDPSFSMPLIGKPFFDATTHDTVKNMTAIHHYNFDDEQCFNDDHMTLNKSMGLPQPINYNNIAQITHRLGVNHDTENRFCVDFKSDAVTNNEWDGRYATYDTKHDAVGWRWVLNRWKPPQHLQSIACPCVQCRESADIYNKKYYEAMNDYDDIARILPKHRENEDGNHCAMDVDTDTQTAQPPADATTRISDPKIVHVPSDISRKIPVIIESKHGKVLSHFVVPSASNIENEIEIDFGSNPPPIYNEMNDILESKNTPKKNVKKSASLSLLTTSADDTSDAAFRALYGQYSQMQIDTTNEDGVREPAMKKRKLNDGSVAIDDIKMDDGYKVELDSFRTLQKTNILQNHNNRDSLCKYLSDTVYDLYERIRSNDSIKHMIRTNLANKIKTKTRIKYEKLHEIVVKHSIEHSCIWLRIRTSLARGYSDSSGTYSIKLTEGDSDEDYSVCTVCFDGSFCDDNPIVFCDECNVGIHRYCYGIEYVPNENDTWYCDGCQWMMDNSDSSRGAQCCLCPIKGCAVKQTKCGGFAHVACALWMKGIDIGNLRRMAPICGVLKVQKQQSVSAIKIHSLLLQNGLAINNGLSCECDEKMYLEGIGEWSHKCIVCGDDNGCFIECAHDECMDRMHVLCAWFAGYNMRIFMDENDNEKVFCTAYCLQHTPIEYGGAQRNVSYYKQMRGNGTTEKKNIALLQTSTRQDKYNQIVGKLSSFPDKYPTNQCAVCFTDYTDDCAVAYQLIQCVSCGVEVHQACYNVMNTLDTEWKCDVCCCKGHAAYDNKDIECMVCPRRGGAFKQIVIDDANECDMIHSDWVHVSCGQWTDAMRFNKKFNKFMIISNAFNTTNANCCCYLCTEQEGVMISCGYKECQRSFHVICGLFGECYLAAHQKEDAFVFQFYCRKHKYAMYPETRAQSKSLGEHLFGIKRLERKLEKIELIEQRISEYELNQRGIINETTAAFRECGTRKTRRKKKKSKKKTKHKKIRNHKRQNNNNKCAADEVSVTDTTSCAENCDEENEQFTQRRTRSSSMKSNRKKAYKKREKDRRKEITDGIIMATDIWVEPYQYEGGEIKWPVIKRNGWFMVIPRLKLPKGNKFRYSHLERKQKQELLAKEKEREKQREKRHIENDENNEWNNFLQKIKEKEKEIEMNTNDESVTAAKQNNESKTIEEGSTNEDDLNKYNRYKAGGPGWELTNDLKQPSFTDPKKHSQKCPYCHKPKHPTISQHNWSRHLNAKHVFKCKKCELYFTRHQLLTQHLKQCKK
eukprot:479109_1